MFLKNVIFKDLTFLLHHLSGHVADITFIMFIIVKRLIFLSKTCKSIEHNSLNDITKEESEKSQINHIVSESPNFKGFHSFYDSAWHIKWHHTVENVITHLIDTFSFTVNIFHIIAEGDSTKNKHENDTHKADIKQAFNVNSNCFEDIGQYLNFAENIN